jgi:2'-5' RNA ligase
VKWRKILNDIRGAEAGRYFIGIPVSEEERICISDELSRVFPEGVPGRETNPVYWHFTLAFLGLIDSESLRKITGVLQENEFGKSFSFKLTAFGAFPGFQQCRVLWLGPKASMAVDSSETNLDVLTQKVQKATTGVLTTFKIQPVVHHLTLSRFSKGSDFFSASRVWQIRPVTIFVDRICLFESVNENGKMIYPVRFTRMLAG